MSRQLMIELQEQITTYLSGPECAKAPIEYLVSGIGVHRDVIRMARAQNLIKVFRTASTSPEVSNLIQRYVRSTAIPKTRGRRTLVLDVLNFKRYALSSATLSELDVQAMKWDMACAKLFYSKSSAYSARRATAFRVETLEEVGLDCVIRLSRHMKVRAVPSGILDGNRTDHSKVWCLLARLCDPPRLSIWRISPHLACTLLQFTSSDTIHGFFTCGYNESDLIGLIQRGVLEVIDRQ